MNETTVAIVEGEVLIALDLQCLCEEAGCCVLGIATTAAGAQQKFSDVLPDVLIADMDLADSSDGVEVVEQMRILRPDVAVIFVTATTAPGKLHRIAAARPDRVLKKPLRVEHLLDALVKIAR